MRRLGQIILALLEERGDWVPIEALADAVYAEAPRPRAWEASVKSMVSRLREQLPDDRAIVCRGRAFRLEVRRSLPPGAAAARALPNRFYGDLRPRAGR